MTGTLVISGLEKQLSDKLLAQSETSTARRKAFFQRLGRNLFPFALATTFALGGYNLKNWADEKDKYLEVHSKPYASAYRKTNSLRELAIAGLSYDSSVVNIEIKMQDDIKNDIQKGRDKLYPKEADNVLAFMKENDVLFTKPHASLSDIKTYTNNLALKTASLEGGFHEFGYDSLWFLGWISTYIASSFSFLVGASKMCNDYNGRIPSPRESQDCLYNFLDSLKEQENESLRGEVLATAVNYVNVSDEKRYKLFSSVKLLGRLNPKKHPRTIEAINKGKCKKENDLVARMREETPFLFDGGI